MGVLSTRMYGVVPLGLWLKARPRVSRTWAWGVFGAEFLFGFVLLAPDPIAWALIVGGLGFHAATATLMGLNTFFWAFVAAYPALIWCRFG